MSTVITANRFFEDRDLGPVFVIGGQFAPKAVPPHPRLDLRGQPRLGPTKHPVERPPRAWFRWILDRGHDPAVPDHRLFRPDREQDPPRRHRQRRAMSLPLLVVFRGPDKNVLLQIDVSPTEAPDTLDAMSGGGSRMNLRSPLTSDR